MGCDGCRGLGARVGIFLGQILDCGDYGAAAGKEAPASAVCGCAANSAWTDQESGMHLLGLVLRKTSVEEVVNIDYQTY